MRDASAFLQTGSASLSWCCKGRRNLFLDDRGFSTVGMVLALLITLSLLFSSAQVYRIQSASAQVQNVSDAAALAAEGTVAEYCLIAQVCDAVVLSLSLTGIVVAGIGLVSLCVPSISQIGMKLIDASRSVFSARDKFAQQAIGALNKLQTMLPYLSAAEAIGVMRANSDTVTQANYGGYAVLLPEKGEVLSNESSSGASDVLDSIDQEKDALAQKAQKLEAASKKAQEEKERGFMADCGNNPAYCMYERAESLGGLSELENPLYLSVDAWNFSVPLKRAQVYYTKRLEQEVPKTASVEEKANSALRARFYAYAKNELAKGYVHETETSFEAYFPKLPSNTEEMRVTLLYTEVAYPITTDGGISVMHAWDGCSGADNIVGYGSISQLEQASFHTCPDCKFTASSMGQVAAASTSIDNGFEYHYKRVAEAALAYQEARAQCDPLTNEVQGQLAGLFEGLAGLLKDAGKRIDVSPPGRFGVLVITANLTQTPADSGFVSSFVTSGKTLGARVAVSGASLVSDSPEEGKTILTALLDDVVDDAGNVGTQTGSMVLSLWSGLLSGYARGFDALKESLSNTLDALPLSSASGLGSWAGSAFEAALTSVGLAPAKLAAPKPVLVNTVHPTSTDKERFSRGYLELRENAISLAEVAQGNMFSSVLALLETRVIGDLSEAKIEIARIELFGSEGLSIPLEIAIPQRVLEVGQSVISSAITSLEGLFASFTGMRQWQ